MKKIVWFFIFVLVGLIVVILLLPKKKIILIPAEREYTKIGKELTVIPNGRFITPAGKTFKVAPHPFGLALSRDGNIAVTANSGVAPLSITIIKNIKS